MSSPKAVNAPKYINANIPKQAATPHIPKLKRANNIITKLINVIKENL